ncbi:hypothetical protein EVAR_75272_1 [Eumeta japonica]|uniref:Uncharacterized protein n=1 Tax=Eumeta variegata TaxID=151549 RepID=A0A4C1V8P0_EUMVA|nr:hypothetical protein EVAR_75272_1 [Eumeta japonica]
MEYQSDSSTMIGYNITRFHPLEGLDDAETIYPVFSPLKFRSQFGDFGAHHHLEDRHHYINIFSKCGRRDPGVERSKFKRRHTVVSLNCSCDAILCGNFFHGFILDAGVGRNSSPLAALVLEQAGLPPASLVLSQSLIKLGPNVSRRAVARDNLQLRVRIAGNGDTSQEYLVWGFYDYSKEEPNLKLDSKPKVRGVRHQSRNQEQNFYREQNRERDCIKWRCKVSPEPSRMGGCGWVRRVVRGHFSTSRRLTQRSRGRGKDKCSALGPPRSARRRRL